MAPKNTLLAVGADAPEITALVDKGNGDVIKLSDLCKSTSVVLVFYPADNTAVCTKQLCALRDSFADLQKLDCTVIGVNPASAEKHAAFKSKYNFPFYLAADHSGQIAESYGCKGLFGMNIRTVYVVSKDQKIVYAERGNPPVDEIINSISVEP